MRNQNLLIVGDSLMVSTQGELRKRRILAHLTLYCDRIDDPCADEHVHIALVPPGRRRVHGAGLWRSDG